MFWGVDYWFGFCFSCGLLYCCLFGCFCDFVELVVVGCFLICCFDVELWFWFGYEVGGVVLILDT